MTNAGNRFPVLITRIINDSRTTGLLLLLCTGISLYISNLPGGVSWIHFWDSTLPGFHQLYLPHSYLHFINDALMAVFFFLVGLEIKRELLDGALSSAKKASLPAVAAIGGMLLPALIFSFFNKGTDSLRGWAIPASTDIAFSLGIASLLGKRVPASLKVFLTALAIMDDLGAIVIIAFFYGDPIKVWFFMGAGVVIFFIYLLNKKLRKFGIFQLILGIILWWMVYNSGIHATVGGVLLAFLVPRDQLAQIEHKLNHFVYLAILPLFALANTAVVFPQHISNALGNPLSWGIILGLFIGKPVGIFFSSYFLVTQKKAELPSDVSWHQLTGAGILAGIGFTMSIFISSLAFPGDDKEDIAKIAVIVGSFLSMIIGYLWLRLRPVAKKQ
jgi:Na+:H+ antiporter, NhaA family